MKRVAVRHSGAKEVGAMPPTANPASPTRAKLTRNPQNHFEAWDEFGVPCLPITCDDDEPSMGIAPGPLGIVDPDSGPSLISSLAAQLNWRT